MAVLGTVLFSGVNYLSNELVKKQETNNINTKKEVKKPEIKKEVKKPEIKEVKNQVTKDTKTEKTKT